jgi:hypothetical protein
MSSRNDWLANVSEGDHVLIEAGISDMLRPAVITRVTATQIIIGDHKYRRRDGTQHGNFGAWTPAPRLLPSTPETTARYREQQDAIRRGRLISEVIDAIRSAPLQVVERVHATLSALNDGDLFDLGASNINDEGAA